MNLPEYLIIKQQTVLFKISLEDLEYLEGAGRKTILHLGEETVTASARLSQLEQYLPSPPFCRCHQGYIINMEHTLQLQRSMVMTASGTWVPVSRTHQGTVRSAFLKVAMKT